MRHTLKAGVVAIAAAATAAYAGTTFSSTWKAPDTGPLNFKGQKVVALVMTADESVRFGAEDALAHQLTLRGAVGVPAYSVVPKELTKDKDKAREYLERSGAVGAVAMRVVANDKELNASSAGYSSAGIGYWGSPVYTAFYGGGFYGYGWGGVYMPSYARTDTILAVETLVYDLRKDKLVWAGLSRTKNPSKVGEFIKELTAKAAAEMRKQGLIGR
jgi:hypothetical protein